MLTFSQEDLKSQARRLQARFARILFHTRHLRISIACLLLSFWLLWLIALSELLFSYSIWPINTCLDSTECSALSFIVGLHGIALSVGTVGWICSSPTLSTVLVVPPLCFGGGMTGVVVSLWVAELEEPSKSYLTTPEFICFICLWMFIVYAVIIIARYCRYLKALCLIRSRNRFNVDVFKERLFGTPPLKEFSRMEFPRCSTLSDSIPDDIFGDYEPDSELT
uniref:Transmembrane protein n=1 Tax=Haemonchus contortus TaxID=6289 RepID=A0A7I4YJ21_HAECO